MKQVFPYLVIAILVFLLVKDCGGNTYIKEKPKTNTFKVENPQPITLYDTIYVDSVTTKIVVKENPVNQALLAKYKAAKDSLERLQLYKQAVTQRTYKQLYEDSTQAITVTSKVTGTLDSQGLIYTFKPSLTTTTSQTNRGLYLGLSLKANYKPLNRFEPQISLNYLNNKTLYGLSIGTETITLTYSKWIF